MKRLFKNKKTMMGLIATLVGVTVLLAGLTLAWWSAEDSSDYENIVTFGVMEIEVEIFNPFIEQGYPGWDSGDRGILASVKNTGTFDGLVAKLDFVIEWTDDPEDEDSWEVVPAALAEEILITVVEDGRAGLVKELWEVEAGARVKKGEIEDYKVHELGGWFLFDNDADFNLLAFYNWSEIDGSLFVTMDGDSYARPATVGNHELHFAYDIELGKDLDEEFMGKAIKVTIDAKATSAFPDGAAEDVFGIADFWTKFTANGFTGFAFVYDDDVVPPFTPFGFAAPAKNLKALTDRIESLPDGGYKDVLIAMYQGINS